MWQDNDPEKKRLVNNHQWCFKEFNLHIKVEILKSSCSKMNETDCESLWRCEFLNVKKIKGDSLIKSLALVTFVTSQNLLPKEVETAVYTASKARVFSAFVQVFLIEFI